MAGGERTTGVRSGTPWGELERIEDERERRAEERTRTILEAMLEASGSRGYRRVSVQDVIDSYGGNRVHFYRHFRSKADCFACAYEAGIGQLSDRILRAAAAAGGWRPGVRAALDELAAFAAESPQLARGLVIEVQLAGGESAERRADALARLARALDRGREEPNARRSPPAITAPFLVGAVEAALRGALERGGPRAFADAVPELSHLTVSTYLGAEEASRGEERGQMLA